MFGLWLGFMGLAGAMALLFWMVLHFSVKNKYQEQTENDLKMAAQSIWDMYGDADFEANIALLAKSNDYFVQIVSENSMQVVFSVNNQGERTAPQQADIADETMFERLNDSDGICQYYVEDQVHASRWAVQAVVLANLNGSRQVLEQIPGEHGCTDEAAHQPLSAGNGDCADPGIDSIGLPGRIFCTAVSSSE